MDIIDKALAYYKRVEMAKNLGYYPYFTPIESVQDRRVRIMGRELIMIGSNNYLGLTNHPKLKRMAQEAVAKYGTTCSGSRFLNGTLDIHIELEKRLAEFFEKDEAIVFSTGFQTNLGIISSLVGKDDYVIIDRQDHASIIDGCRLSFGTILKYGHNDMDDLKRILEEIPKDKGKLIVVDGVFSMEGDLAPLPDIVELKERYNARLLVDDAHGVGVLGEKGRGTCEHFGLLDRVDFIMGTFSKSFASLGGFVVGDHKPITYSRHNARSLIFSASMVPASVASALGALEIIETEPERRQRLREITEKMLNGYKALGLDTGDSCTPIIPIIIGDDMKTFTFWKRLFEKGVFVNPVISPAVPQGRQLLRTSYMATHTDEDLDLVLKAFREVVEELGA
ncbi:8-amino-7-oxononanoate synthase [candidate division WOR-3 bacterium]|uniref:8-amino-7-oxononanoate synthase n=1 Tax=candidate division WOR-3 bacterium TaxID=2052148 RepID=A0A660SEV0_UNCW3|nr:MAG: 8-amino-7-oxononanoate synthase [candidate division WOR-3 bacterium]